MSHTSYKSAKTRLQRSELAVPGSSPKMFEKALNSDADYIFLDLEDAVSPNDKVTARENVINALKDLDWRGHGKTISVRINGLDTHYMYRDVVELMIQAGEFIDTLLIPKVGVRDDVYMVDCMVTQIEQERELKNKVGLECLIESALGMVNIEDIAQSSDRLEALHFGVADYAASLRARTVVIGGLNPDYPGDQWHHGLSKLVATCRAYGLRPIDGPFGDIKDPDGYIKAAKRGAAIGIEGKWAIHPSQIEHANDVFSPPQAEVDKAKRIIEELAKAAAEGKGAAQLDGRMIDAASERMAENIVNIDNLIQSKKIMNIHEYQAKEILSRFGVSIPKGGVAYSPENAKDRATELGGDLWVVKAQIHSGARGKAGGIIVCKSEQEVSDAANKLLGKTLVTHQTGPEGKTVQRIYVEEGTDIKKEFYLGLVFDRSTESIMVVASSEGGMSVEEIAEEKPESLIKTRIEAAVGMQAYQAREIAFALGLESKAINRCAQAILGAYKAFSTSDATMVEINPLVLTGDDHVLALDCKMSFDDNALYRNPELAELRDKSQEDPKETYAADRGLNLYST